jgi:hypothetical protein
MKVTHSVELHVLNVLQLIRADGSAPVLMRWATCKLPVMYADPLIILRGTQPEKWELTT